MKKPKPNKGSLPLPDHALNTGDERSSAKKVGKEELREHLTPPENGNGKRAGGARGKDSNRSYNNSGSNDK
jgi:hypothetical protein